MSLRAAQTEVQNTIAQRQQQQTQSHLETSVTLRAQFETDWTAKGRRPKPSRKRANFSPQRNLRLPEKNTMFGANPNIQIVSWCHCSNAIYGTVSCKTQSELQHGTEEQVPFEKPWRSQPTAICTDWSAKHNNTASTTTDTKSPGDLSCTARAIRDRFDGKAAPPETVAQACQLFSAAEPPFTRKNTMFGANPNISNRILMSLFQRESEQQWVAKPNQDWERNTARKNKYPSRSLDTAIPLRSAQTEVQNTKAQHQQQQNNNRQKVTWRPQLHCARNPRQIRRQSGAARNRRASEPTFLRSGTSVYPKKHNVWRKS